MGSPQKLAPNIYFHSLYVPRIGWWRTSFAGCILAVRKKMRQIQPDIVHGQGTEGDCAISAVYSRFPNVLTIHGNMRLIARVTQAKPWSFPWISAKLESFTVPRSLGVVCITRYTQEAMRGLAKRTWVLPNAVDEAFFDVQPAGAPHLPPLILCVGHVCARKNQNAFIRALDGLAEKERFRVLFLGQTSPGRAYDDEFLALVSGRPWCEYGRFAGRDKLRGYFREAALVALPSLEDNCPMVVLEAMAAGVPVVAARVGGVPDLLREPETGIFCNPLDAGSMAAAIGRALDNRPLAREVAARARAEARRRFHPKVIACGHLEIYREVLRGGSGGRPIG
jgi:glycosyltransferase involved in cell wall biosynthesis